MKKIFLLFASAAIVAALLCCSCQKERYVEELDTIEGSSEGVVRSISFSVDAFEIEDGTAETKSTYDASGNFYFAATDTVGIFPSKGGQVYFEIPSEYVGKQSVRFDGGGWALKESFSYWSYSPLVGDFYLKKDHIPVEYTDLTQKGNETLDHISPVDFLYTDQCTVQNGSLSFAYHRLNCILRPRVTLPAGTYSKIVIQAENDVFVSKGYYDLTADAPAIIGTEFTDHLTLNLKNVSFSEETAFVGNLMTAPVDISNMPIKVIIYSGDTPVYYYTYERTSPLKANTPYGLRCTDLRVYVDSESSANEAFANGFQSVEFIFVPSGNIALELPQTTDDVSILFPDSESDISVSVSYPDGASSKPANVLFDGPDGSNVVLNVPNSTVTLGRGDYNTVESTTAPNTLIIPEDVNICTLNLRQGSVVVYGHVDTFNCEDMEDKEASTVTVNGTVDSFLEEEGVTIITPITSLSLDHDSIDVSVGESIELHPSWTPSYATGVELEWSSSDESIVTVSPNGVVQGVSAGEAVITVSVAGNSGIYVTCSVTVPLPPQVNNVIYYTSYDGNVVAPFYGDSFGANIVSNNYVDGQGTIVFDRAVTGSLVDAFKNRSGLTTITIPESVSTIGTNAFYYCQRLTSITIPESVTSIGSEAFYYCNSLTSLVIPENVTSIGNYAFSYCNSLSSITINAISPPTLTYGTAFEFTNCPIYVPSGSVDTYKAAEYWSYYADRIQAIPQPNNVIYYTSNDGNVVTPYATDVFGANIISNEYIGERGIITFDESITNIGSNAFDACLSLTSITIPESVTSIGEKAFLYCSNLTSITIPESVTSIGVYAFQDCTSLANMSIPVSVTTIGSHAFIGCSSLTSITIPESITSIGEGVFYECRNLTSITIPESVTSIGTRAFYDCRSLTSITIPESVTSIGDSAFDGCSSLTRIMIPESVTTIGGYAFEYCSSLTSIEFRAVTPPKGGSNLFNNTNNCPIYVPSESVGLYKSAWIAYADRIQAIQPNYASEPFTITSNGTTSVSFTKVGTPPTHNYEYKKGEGDWVGYSIGSSIELADKETLQLRQKGTYKSGLSKDSNNYYTIQVEGSGNVIASGNIMSLLDGSLEIEGNLKKLEYRDYVFYQLFRDCSKLMDASKLILPATTLSNLCYSSMFRGCSNLIAAPELLPATTLATNCYDCMFLDCSSLTVAPELPATTLEMYCYRFMFGGCSSLTATPDLLATTLATNCYESMFERCTSLTKAPELSATTMVSSCYMSMFKECSSLTIAPELPATTLASGCYESMFDGCSSLNAAPELPATLLESSCYASMFKNCSSLTTAPELPALTLKSNCYYYMFAGCSNLSFIKALFTSKPSSEYTAYWLKDVSATGTFVKNKDATWDVTGFAGIPSGWTVLTE